MVLCFVFVLFVFLIGLMMFWLDQELIGLINLGWYFYVYVFIGLVNMWVVGMVLFVVVNFICFQIFVWVVFFGLLVFYFVGSVIVGQELELCDELVFIDLFVFNIFGEMMCYWIVFEVNIQVILFEGLFLMNWLIWIGIGLGLLLFSVFIFCFCKGGLVSVFKKSKVQVVFGLKSVILDFELLCMQLVLNGMMMCQQFFVCFGFEVKGVVLNVVFWVILVFGLFNIVFGFFFVNGIYGMDNYLVIWVMMNIINGVYLIILIIIVIYYVVELMWCECCFCFNEIMDVMLILSWVFIIFKFLVMMVVILLLVIVVIVVVVLLQLVMGYIVIEMDQYMICLIMEIVILVGLFFVLVIFLQVLLNNCWLGMVVMLVFFVVLLIMSQIGFDYNFYQYGGLFGVLYLDMNGYGYFLGILFWFMLYWSFWVLFLMVLVYQFWSCGVFILIGICLKNLFVGFILVMVGFVIVLLVGVGVIGGWIYYNINILNQYIFGLNVCVLQVEYEWIYDYFVDLF